MGLVGAGDEAFGAVDHVVVAVAHRGGAHAAGIGPGIGLGLREADSLLPAQHRHQIFLLHLSRQRVEDRAHRGAGDALAARRQRDRARKLLGDDAAREQGEAGAAIFLRHFHHPNAEVFGPLAEAFEELRLDLFALRGDGLALDRDQLGVDETAERVLEQAQLLGQFEIHHASPLPSFRHNTRTSTATAPRPSARTISGLISISSMRAR